MDQPNYAAVIPWFGARKMVRELLAELQVVRAQRDEARNQLERLGALSVIELEARRLALEQEIAEQTARLAREKSEAAAALDNAKQLLDDARQSIVVTEDLALLQEVGIYQYQHPLTDAVGYEQQLAWIGDRTKIMAKENGGAVLADGNWTVNGSVTQGRAMAREYSKLMLRAFNAEADTLVRGLKPYKLDGARSRLKKASETIERLGKTMKLRISEPYYKLRELELELTSDFLQKQAEDKEAERNERIRLREERKAQQEFENERARLEKEQEHYKIAIQALVEKKDEAGAELLQRKSDDIGQAIKTVNDRAANIRIGYVYVISNVGSFGEKMVKVGLTRRLEPLDRIRELSDSSVPFNFDVHALFFSQDAVGLEASLHERLANLRVNIVNPRREFFYATPLEVKAHLLELTAQRGVLPLAGEMLEFHEVPEAIEYRQSIRTQSMGTPSVKRAA